MNIAKGKLIAYDTFLFPSFFIGTEEEYTRILNLINEWENIKSQPAVIEQKSKLLAKNIDKFLKITFHFKYSDCWIVFRRDGFFYIAKKEQDLDKQFAVEKLNEIIAIFTYYLNIPFHSVNYSEVQKIGHRDLIIKSIQYRSDTALTKLISRQVHSANREYLFNDFITPKTLEVLINRFKSLSNHPNISQFLYFFQKASQFKYNYELGMAFLMYFLIIERYYRQQFEDLNKTLQLKKQYKDASKMNLHSIIKILHSNGVISNHKQIVILNLKDIRNQFAHGKLKQEINTEIFEQCIGIATNLLKKVIEDLLKS